MRFLAVLSTLVVAIAAHDVDVDIQSGPILGRYVDGMPTVREFLGIPYGKAPIGNLRWAPAQKPDPWTTRKNTTAFGDTCIHTRFGVNLGSSPISGNIPTPPSESEDCLSINVWTPTEERLESSKAEGGAAVMLWIYGGAFQIGGSFTTHYNGARIVRDQEDVIVVTFNYRINIFGFPGATVLGNKKNPGLHDVRSAVEWVRDNIAAFGGNPEKIMLFGESAGGAATDTYVYNYVDDPIIHGAAMESGTSIMSSGAGGLSNVAWDLLALNLGCLNLLNAQTQLSCMRAVPALRLRDAVLAANMSFSPTPDGGTVPTDMDARLRSGRFAKIPILVGSNHQEIPTPGSAMGELTTTMMFTCPAAKSARFHSQYVKTWQYRYFGSYPTGSPEFNDPGAFHTAEIAMIFGTYNDTVATEAMKESSRYMQGAWVAFAKDPENGLVEYGKWPTYDQTKPSLVRLSYNNVPGATFVLPSTHEAGCTF